jgi:hypothetical protein
LRPAIPRAIAAVASLLTVAGVAGCGSSRSVSAGSGIPLGLLAEARPIGRGAAFHPPARGPVTGPCRRGLGVREGAHVEVFAGNRVLIVAAGIGARGPWTFSAGRISGARCYGDLVTLEPTGVVLVRAGVRVSVSDLFLAWGQPLSQRKLAGFSTSTGTRVSAFVGGHRWHGAPGSVPLARHSEIVLEIGPYVPPHSSYTFPPGT